DAAKKWLTLRALTPYDGMNQNENGAFLRWRELSLTYNLPGRWSEQHFGLRQVSLRASVRNLKLWTGYHGIDPELNVFGRGAASATARAWGTVLTPYSEATDELTWIGSRDAWGDLDQGYLSGITNEFVDAAFPSLAQARWLGDEAIKRLSKFDADGVLPNRDDLARSYLYAAIAYVTIGDMFDDWPIGSDRQVAARPLGPSNMAQVYDTAVVFTTRGIAIAQATGSKDLVLALTAMRARA